MHDSDKLQPIVVTTTSDQKDVLKKLAGHVVQQKLGACVQISGPIESCYLWQEKLETSSEWLCTIKTIRQKYKDLEQSILSLHNYEEPEIIAVEICAGSQGYLDWVAENLAWANDHE